MAPQQRPTPQGILTCLMGGRHSASFRKLRRKWLDVSLTRKNMPCSRSAEVRRMLLSKPNSIVHSSTEVCPAIEGHSAQAPLLLKLPQSCAFLLRFDAGLSK